MTKRPHKGPDRLERNRDSRAKADHLFQPWTEYEDETLQTLFDPHAKTSEQDLVDLAEMLGRTIEGCRERYYKVRRAESVTYTTSTRTINKNRTETHTTNVERRRPKWMDDAGLPDWYV